MAKPRPKNVARIRGIIARCSTVFTAVKLGGTVLTGGGTDFVNDGAATAANPSVVTSGAITAGHTFAAGDSITYTYTDTASTNSWTVTLNFNGTAWTATVASLNYFR